MERLPNLGSLRSIANNYEEDGVSDDEERLLAKRRKLSTEDEEKSVEKGDDTDVDIVLSDEEGSSGAGSLQNAVVSQPRVTKDPSSRLVSYGGDEDDDGDAMKIKGNENPAHDENNADVQSTEMPSKEDQEPTQPAVQEKTAVEESKDIPGTHEKQENMEDETKKGSSIPKPLLDHLLAVKSIQVNLPEEPEGRCSNSLQEKIEKLLENKRRNGRNLKDTIQRKKNFRNPSIYEKLVSFCSINEIGTNYPPNIYDPFSWPEDSFYERLSKIQKELHEKKQKERSKVEFISATKKTVTVADDASKKRKSKWDVTSSGTAAPSLVLPPSAIQTIASVQAVVAANSRIIPANTTSNAQVKKPL